METIYLEARYGEKFLLPDSLIKKLPEIIALFTTIQFYDSIEGIKKQLIKKNKKPIIIKTKHTKYPGQLLGCNIEKFNQEKDCFLYIGDGEFHPIALSIKNHEPIYIFNPKSKKHYILENNQKILKKINGALLKFYASKEIGVLISVKPGQSRLKDALGLKKKYPEKNFYFLIFGTLDYSQLENFPFVEMYVNTACPRIAFDEHNKSIINIDEILD